MWRLRRGNKYNAQSSNYNGRSFDSKKEAAYAAELDLRKRAGDILDWTPQVKIPLDVNGHHIANYYIDFVVEHPNETREYVEVKGFETDVWRLKWKLFEALYGDATNTRLTVIK